MRVLVCGGRNFNDRDYVFEALDVMHGIDAFCFLITGGATGADASAKEWAISRKIPGMEYRANWKKYGRNAGPRRNRRMLREGRPDLVVAFPGGAGTADMCAIARWHDVVVAKMSGK